MEYYLNFIKHTYMYVYFTYSFTYQSQQLPGNNKWLMNVYYNKLIKSLPFYSFLSTSNKSLSIWASR